MPRGVRVLPADDEEVLIDLTTVGGNRLALAARYGCSESAVHMRLRAIQRRRGLGIERRRIVRLPTEDRLELIEMALHQVAETLLSLIEIERQRASAPPSVVMWKPDHKRVADGGTPVRKQRAEMKAAVSG